MNNILIPTDFTINSVKLAIKAARAFNEKVNIIFFHAFAQPYFYNDLLSCETPYAGLMNDDIRQACKQIKDQYPEIIGTITFRFMRGNTQALFRNFIEANNINMIFYPKNYTYEKIHAESINPLPFFKRSKLPVLQNINQREKFIVTTGKEVSLSLLPA